MQTQATPLRENTPTEQVSAVLPKSHRHRGCSASTLNDHRSAVNYTIWLY